VVLLSISFIFISNILFEQTKMNYVNKTTTVSST